MSSGLPRPGLAHSAHSERIKLLRGYVSKSSAVPNPLTITQLACERPRSRSRTALRVPVHQLASLGSRPSPYVRVLIARGWANRRAGKAWDDSPRESRTVVGQYLARAPWCRRGTLFSRYQAFLTRCFWQTVEAKSKTIGC